MKALVGSVRMYGSDVCLFDTAKIIDYLDHWGRVVRGAGSTRDDMVVLGDGIFIDAQNDHFDGIIRGGDG